MDINLIIKMAHITIDEIENNNAINHSSKYEKFNGVADLARTMIWNEIDNGNVDMSIGFRAIDALTGLCFTPSPMDNFI